jgi:hypothetical protein
MFKNKLINMQKTLQATNVFLNVEKWFRPPIQSWSQQLLTDWYRNKSLNQKYAKPKEFGLP